MKIPLFVTGFTAVTLPLLGTFAYAQCTVVSYKVVSPTLVAVRCTEINTESLTGRASFSTAATPNATLEGSFTGYPGSDEWLIVTLTAPRRLTASTKYKLSLSFVPQTAARAEPIDIDTTSGFTVTSALSSNHRRTFDFSSNVLVLQTNSVCDLRIDSPYGVPRSLDVEQCDVPVTERMVKSSSPAKAIGDPLDIGVVHVTLKKNASVQVLPVGLDGVNDVFGKQPKIDSKSRLVSPKAPASKDVASYYINFSDLAATGSSPSWALDGRIAPALGRLRHGFQLSPLATACVGQGQVPNQSYTDVIDFGGTEDRIFEPNKIIQGLQITPGVIYETDKEFDRHNLLATGDLRFNFAYSYNTRLRQQESKLQNLRDSQTAKGQPADAQNSPIPWTLDDIKPPFWGYAYDLHAFVELGGALTDATITATKGGATHSLPRYNIARVGPKVHTLFEFGRGSLDTVVIGRYLTATENSVFQTPSNSLYLKRFSGWKGYLNLVGSLSLDPEGHVSIAVTYQDGFCAPKFNRSNAVLTGIVIKY